MASMATDTRVLGSVVAGERRADGARIESRNPAHLDDVVAEVALADAAPFGDACRAAHAAQAAWAATPAPVRGGTIREIGRLVESNKQELARLVTREIGKPYAESL